ncbi:TNF receptor-associated factor 3-like [Dysidea avara]|uniref:TNF receptor-associated factor 3-like n=1 Tax=Dysidea avara TaxID=196820 RepID=UPI0033319B76
MTCRNSQRLPRCKENVATHLALTRQELIKASEKLKKTEEVLTTEVKTTTERYESTLKEIDSPTRRLTKTQEVESTKVLLAKAESKLSQGLAYVESATQIRVNELEKPKLRSELNTQLEKIFTTADWNTKIAWQVTCTKENQVAPVWIRMPDYANLKRQSEQWCSPPFYTYSGGYRMCLCICAAGDDGGIGTHMSAYACVMKGAYDDSVPWPLQGNLEVVILNQNNNTDHFGKTIHYTGDNTTDTGNRVVNGELGKARGYPLFISNKDLKGRHCIKHNSVCFQVIILYSHN